jgi:hypothetical protein
MIRFLPFIVELALLVFCVIDIIQSDEYAVRNLARGWWLVLVIVMPLVGGIAWLVAGRPQGARTQGMWAPGAGFPEEARPLAAATDADRALQAELDRVDREYEESLRRSEERLRARAAELRAREAELDRRERGTEPGPGADRA